MLGHETQIDMETRRDAMCLESEVVVRRVVFPGDAGHVGVRKVSADVLDLCPAVTLDHGKCVNRSSREVKQTMLKQTEHFRSCYTQARPAFPELEQVSLVSPRSVDLAPAAVVHQNRSAAIRNVQ